MEVMMKALGVLIVMSPLFYCAGLLLASMGLHFYYTAPLAAAEGARGVRSTQRS
jgi:hypothetical protein